VTGKEGVGRQTRDKWYEFFSLETSISDRLGPQIKEL
jgi:hypothetical protein